MFLLLAFYWTCLTGQSTFFIKDSTHFFEPLCRFIGTSLRNGHIPLWNPYNYCGMSECAISSPSIFYPPNWLFALLPFSPALAWIMIISQVAAAIGTFLLVRAVGWRTVSAAISGCTVGLCGYMFSLTSNYTLVATAGWLPLAALCVVRYQDSEKRLWLVGNAVAIALMISAGRPEIFLPGLIVLLCLSLVRQRENMVKQLGSIAASMFVGILLAMPTLAPSLEWLPLSRRAQGLEASETFIYSVDWYQLLSMFVMQPLDNMQLRGSPFASLIAGFSMVPYYDSAFVGTIILALALLGLSRRGGVIYRCTVGLLLVAILFSLGANIPATAAIFHSLPAASLLRFPSKLLFFVVFPMALLAARGGELYLRRAVNLAPWLVVWAVAIAASVVLFFSNDILLPLTTDDHSLANVAQTVIALRCAVSATLALASLIFMWLLGRFGKQHVALIVVASIAAFGLVYNGLASTHIFGPPNFFEEPFALLDPIKANSNSRVCPLMFEKFTAPRSVESTDRLQSTINDYQYTRQVLRALTNIDGRFSSVFGLEGSPVADYHRFFLRAYRRSSQAINRDTSVDRSDELLYRLLQCGAAEYVLTQDKVQLKTNLAAVPDLDTRWFELVQRNEQANLKLFKLKQPLPRAYMCTTWQILSSHDEVMATMRDPGRTGFDPSKQSLVEGNTRLRQGGAPLIVPVAVEERGPNEVSMTVDAAPAEQLLVLQDQFYPGWHVTIDGRDATLQRCNGFFRGVFVPHGHHVVRFQYWPVSLVLGVICFVIGFACVVGVLFLELASPGPNIQKALHNDHCPTSN